MIRKIKSTIKNLVLAISEKSIVARKVIRSTFDLYRKIKYKIATVGIKIDEKTIMFCVFNGKSYTCSPKAIYEYMIKSEEYKEYKFIWAFKSVEKYNFLEKNRNTKVVKMNSKEYKKYLAKAKYWIFNYKIPDYLYPKKEQVFVQCWHGTPLKRLGCDLEHFDNVLNTMEGMKKRYKIEASKFSYFISPSKFASEKFISAWNLKEIGKENIIIEEGYPRNDFLYNYTLDDLKQIKQKLKIPQDKKVILYAPTYRDNQHKSGVGYVYQTKVNFDFLKEKLQEEYVILFRAHYLVSNSFDFEKYKGFIYNVSEYDDINHLYIISDLLITDYSSVFFDYANLKRPIIFYMYDLEEYKEELRGFYLNISDLPGEIVQTQEELIDSIENTKRFVYNKNYQLFNNKYNYLDDGQASKRVVEKIIK